MSYSEDHSFSQAISECFCELGEYQFVNPVSSYPWGGRSRIIARIAIFEKYLKPEDVLHAVWLQRQAALDAPNDWRSKEVGIEYLNKIMGERSRGTFWDELNAIAKSLPTVMDYAEAEYGPGMRAALAESKRKEVKQRRSEMRLVAVATTPI